MVVAVPHCLGWLAIQQRRWSSMYVSSPVFVDFVSCLWSLFLLHQCCQNLGCLCTNANQKYGDRVTEEKERVALLLCQAKGKHSRLAPQGLCPLPGEEGEITQSGTGM